MAQQQGPEFIGSNSSNNLNENLDVEVGATLSTARFLLHFKQHGLTYAIVALLAEQAGILQMLLSTAGGMC